MAESLVLRLFTACLLVTVGYSRPRSAFGPKLSITSDDDESTFGFLVRNG